MLDWLILFFRIAGLGGNFSAGYDLGELAKIEKEDIANELVRYFSTYKLFSKGGFLSEDIMMLVTLPNYGAKSQPWAENLNKLFTVMGCKFKFSAQDCDLAPKLVQCQPRLNREIQQFVVNGVRFTQT